ncbi:hypothetical protein FMEAI12_4370003 [Parafrankia sp. Ea1.12]|nr:hypothetical protein FMEAI12_4370003 [Parafrankia sp. Ea1.12]
MIRHSPYVASPPGGVTSCLMGTRTACMVRWEGAGNLSRNVMTPAPYSTVIPHPKRASASKN